VNLVEDSLCLFAERCVGIHTIRIHTYISFVKKKMAFAKNSFSSGPATAQITPKSGYSLREENSFFIAALPASRGGRGRRGVKRFWGLDSSLWSLLFALLTFEISNARRDSCEYIRIIHCPNVDSCFRGNDIEESVSAFIRVHRQFPGSMGYFTSYQTPAGDKNRTVSRPNGVSDCLMLLFVI
jgi:hypothetical protein